VLVNVDVQGAATIRGIAARDPELQRSLVTIFLSPPSLELLAQRLRKRGTDSEKVIARRLRAAKREIKAWRHFDYLIITNTVELDRQHALAIIESEKMRCLRSQAPAI
jgi:guanylate kinase